MRTSIDSATQRANAAGNHDTAHGFAFTCAVVNLTVATATTDTIADTKTNITPSSFPIAESFTDCDVRSAPSVAVPVIASDADDPTKPTCLPCVLDVHDLCLHATRPGGCACDHNKGDS